MFKNARKVHVDGEVYYWVVVNPAQLKVDNKVVGWGHGKIGIHTPEGRNIFPTWSEVTGFTQEQINNRASWCEICDGICDFERENGKIVLSFSPGVIKKYIETHVHRKGKKK